MPSVGFQFSKICMFFFGKFTAEQVLKSFLGRNNSLKPPVFDVCDSLPFVVLKNQESWELWLDGFWGNSKMQKISAKNFLLHLWAAIVEISALKYWILFFLI